ncbi:long-chain-fatty-acid--CoA ligase [Streptomyces sp. NPDC091272]|uniref:long-chain-fatty-acid--CoA ligase n=1 Tax=Streptomyces sp. NPDC091272 TaxID=3365981 RepID=UPI00380FB244
MHSTMPDVPLNIARVLRHGSTVQGSSTVATWNGAEFEHTSYAEVGRRAGRLAHALRDRLGVRAATRPGSAQSVVATFMWNNSRHLELFLAVPAMGAVLHSLNVRMAPQQLAYIIDHAGDEVIVVDADLAEVLAGVLPLLSGKVRHIVVAGPGGREALAGFAGEVHDYEELTATQSPDYPWEEGLDERTAASMCYTSGTTGDPKGVVYSHRSIYLHCLQVAAPNRYDLTSREVLFPVVPMFHVNAWSIPHAAFLTGAGLLMADRFSGAASYARMIVQGRPTFAAAVPSVWAALLQELDTRSYDITGLRRGVAGGAACPPALISAYSDRHSVELLHAWGMSETSSLVSTALPPAGAEDRAAWAYRVSQGQFPASVRFRLADAQGACVPHDGRATGELQLHGPCVTGAYYGGEGSPVTRPPENFTTDGWLRTGDVGRISPDGYLTLTDRAKDIVKSGGEFISTVELESHLMEHPAVAEAAVVAVPDDRWGERPLAAVTLRGGDGCRPEDLRDFLARHVEAWTVPERWTVMPVIPKNAVGKYDKRRIQEEYATGRLDVVRVGKEPREGSGEEPGRGSGEEPGRGSGEGSIQESGEGTVKESGTPSALA